MGKQSRGSKMPRWQRKGVQLLTGVSGQATLRGWYLSKNVKEARKLGVRISGEEHS